MANDKKKVKAPRYKNPSRYRLDFVKENTLMTLWSVRMTRSRVWLASFATFAAFVALIWMVVAYTPLRRLLPGALHGDLRAQYIETAFRLDSLEQAAILNEAYLNNLLGIISGPDADAPVSDAARISVSDSLLAASELEKQFVRSYEEEERFNLSVLSPIAAEGMVFSAPAPMAAYVTTSPGINNIEIHAVGAMPATAVYRGTVISSTVTPEGLSVVVVQHPNDFISIYGGLTDVYVQRGDKIEASRRIGLVPAKGYLSFELWHNGSPLNPSEYIAV